MLCDLLPSSLCALRLKGYLNSHLCVGAVQRCSAEKLRITPYIPFGCWKFRMRPKFSQLLVYYLSLKFAVMGDARPETAFSHYQVPPFHCLVLLELFDSHFISFFFDRQERFERFKEIGILKSSTPS